jgi:HAD superfamily hydrolase (TIGR01509 family)
VIQALIFDFDGLMVDTETPEAQIWQDLYARHGQVFPLAEWVHSVVGAAVANLEPVARLESLTGRRLDSKALYAEAQRMRRALQGTLPPLPGVVETLKSARRLGLLLAIASSSPHAWVDEHLSRLDLRNLFEVVICREDALHVKPAPDLFLAALTALKVPAGQALAFEDSPNGIIAARAAGLRVVGIPNAITSLPGPLVSDLTLASLLDLPLPGLLSHFGDSLALRPETPSDLRSIRLVEESAFPTHMEADLVDLARSRGRITLSMVATSQDDSVLAHVMFTPLTFDPPQLGRQGLGLGPIAVLPEFQHTGIGSRLMRAGLEHVRQLGFGFVVLLGDPGYYARFGFKPGSTFGLTSAYGDGGAFQALELGKGSLADPGGYIKYIPEFDDIGH